jgi:hypothetical protein
MADGPYKEIEAELRQRPGIAVPAGFISELIQVAVEATLQVKSEHAEGEQLPRTEIAARIAELLKEQA